MKYIEVVQIDMESYEVVVRDDSTHNGRATIAGKGMFLTCLNNLSEIVLFVSTLGLPVVCSLDEEEEDECKTECA